MTIRPILPLPALIIATIIIVAAMLYCLFNKHYRRSKHFVRIGVIVAIIVALFRPVIILGEKVELAASNTVVYFIVDSTGSMATGDEGEKTRIEAVRDDIEKILGSFTAPKAGVFIQDIATYQLLPITSDTSAVKMVVGNIVVKDAKHSESTDLPKLIKSASAHYKRYRENDPNAEIVVFIMSDGETFKDENYQLEEGDFEQAAYGAVIGYGSSDGDKVPNITTCEGENGVLNYCQHADKPYLEKNGAAIISKKNTDYLKTISSTYGFSYGDAEDIDAIIEGAKKNTGKTVKTNDVGINASYEIYWIFMMIAGVLLLVDFYRDFNSLLAEREVKK